MSVDESSTNMNPAFIEIQNYWLNGQVESSHERITRPAHNPRRLPCSGRLQVHRYIKQLFLVLSARLAQFERYCSIVKCVLDGPLDTHIWPFSRTLGEEILHLYWIYCFWVPFSGRISHHFPTKPSFSPIFRIARLFENFLYQSISILTWPGAFGGPILLTRTKPDMI